jgi:hypothetical protein
LKIDWNEKVVSAATEPITLQEIDLGPFDIRFLWQRFTRSTDSACFEIVAMEPNPSSVSDDVSHPHVKKNKLCAGEAVMPLRKALEQGRLADAFSLIRSVLLTYNAASPHVALEQWAGTKCHDCGDAVDSESVHYCEGCGDDFCEECFSCCRGCDISRCAGCLAGCDVCETPYCLRCLTPITSFWDALRHSAALFVDGRMSAEVLRILAVDHPATDAVYSTTLVNLMST